MGGVAAKQGPAHVVFWLVALCLFYIPSAAVVIHLNRLMPLEGGLYQWAKLGFNQTVGFLLAWNLWLFAILNTSEIGLQVTQYLVYIMGPAVEGLAVNPWFIGLVSTVTLGALVIVTVAVTLLGNFVARKIGTAANVQQVPVQLTRLPTTVAQASWTAPGFRPLASTLALLPTWPLVSLSDAVTPEL